VAIILRFASRGRLNFEQFDEAYVDRLRHGDPETEEHFTAYFGRLVLIKLSSRLKSRAAIEDVRQETFLRVFRILRSDTGVRHPERLGALVNSVCNNVFLEACRANRPHEPLSEVPGPSLCHDVMDGLIEEEQRREVQRVLDELPERDRRLLRAVFLDEASREAVCAQLEVDRDYLRVLLHRAKEAFRMRYVQGRTPVAVAPSASPRLRSC
jgi:RNA polymerase sigma-70 factor (ECF subfamily)